MKHKPIKVDWEALEDAFSSQNADLVYYLDLIHGKVLLEGEDTEDVEEGDDDYMRAAIPDPPLVDDDTHLTIRPPSTERKIVWLEEFLPRVEDDHAEMVAGLRVAMGADEPAAAIRDVLKQHPDGRDAWFLFRSGKVQEMIESWLEEHAIPYLEPPPWR